jgi:hypothetical protein
MTDQFVHVAFIPDVERLGFFADHVSILRYRYRKVNSQHCDIDHDIVN